MRDYAVNGRDQPLGTLLTEHFEIRTPSRALLTLAASRTPCDGRRDLAVGDTHGGTEGSLAVRQGRAGHHRGRPQGRRGHRHAAPPAVPRLLDRLQPAGSPRQRAPDREPACAYDAQGRRNGSAPSTFLADRCENVLVHLRPNNHFRLPAGDVPIIMIGPGTGIAPFRAFLRSARSPPQLERSWLFFGDRRRATDYLYGEELEEFVVLGRADPAWIWPSRGIKERAKVLCCSNAFGRSAEEFYGWLQDECTWGTSCGDADRMAKGCGRRLHDVIARVGGLERRGRARLRRNDMIKSHRYVRDVY